MLFNEENAQDYKDTFSAFDKDGKDSLPVADLKNALRALGYYPTQEEVRKLEDELKGKAGVTYDEFIEVLKKADKKSVPDRELLSQAFYEFDVNGTGLMTPKELRYILTTMGESWSSQDVDELIKHLGVGDEPFEYRSIVDLMFMTAPFKTN